MTPLSIPSVQEGGHNRCRKGSFRMSQWSGAGAGGGWVERGQAAPRPACHCPQELAQGWQFSSQALHGLLLPLKPSFLLAQPLCPSRSASRLSSLGSHQIPVSLTFCLSQLSLSSEGKREGGARCALAGEQCVIPASTPAAPSVMTPHPPALHTHPSSLSPPATTRGPWKTNPRPPSVSVLIVGQGAA